VTQALRATRGLTRAAASSKSTGAGLQSSLWLTASRGPNPAPPPRGVSRTGASYRAVKLSKSAVICDIVAPTARLPAPQPWVQDVPQLVAEEVEAGHAICLPRRTLSDRPHLDRQAPSQQGVAGGD